MNRITASVFILCIVKLEEFCYKYGFTDYRILSNLLIESCKIDGKDLFNLPNLKEISEIRNSEPFVSLDLSQESFIYATFKELI